MLLMSQSVQDLINAMQAPNLEPEWVDKQIEKIVADQEYSLDDPIEGNGHTLMHLAIINRHPYVVSQLIRAGANVNIETAPLTPLAWAASRGCSLSVNILLAHGADVGLRTQENSKSPLFYAAENGHSRILKALLAAGADANDRRLSLLFSKVGESPWQTTQYALVLYSGTDENGRRIDSWKIRVKNRDGSFSEEDLTHERILELLATVNSGNITEKNNNLFLKLKIEKMFWESIPNISYENQYLRSLHIACQNGHAGCVGILCEHGADFTTPLFDDLYTPLVAAREYAASGDDTITSAIFYQLLKHGAGFGNPNLATINGLFNKFNFSYPFIVIGSGITRQHQHQQQHQGFDCAITNTAELIEWLRESLDVDFSHAPLFSYNSKGIAEPTKFAKFANKYLELCQQRLHQFPDSPYSQELRDFQSILRLHMPNGLANLCASSLALHRCHEIAVPWPWLPIPQVPASQALVNTVEIPNDCEELITKEMHLLMESLCDEYLPDMYKELYHQLEQLNDSMDEDNNIFDYCQVGAANVNYFVCKWMMLAGAVILFVAALYHVLPLLVSVLFSPVSDGFLFSAGFLHSRFFSEGLSTLIYFLGACVLGCLMRMFADEEQKSQIESIFDLLNIAEGIIPASAIKTLRDAKTKTEVTEAIETIQRQIEDVYCCAPELTSQKSLFRNQRITFFQGKQDGTDDTIIELGPEISARESYHESDSLPLLLSSCSDSEESIDSSSDDEESELRSLLING